jgi:hypothetical protein
MPKRFQTDLRSTAALFSIAITAMTLGACSGTQTRQCPPLESDLRIDARYKDEPVPMLALDTLSAINACYAENQYSPAEERPLLFKESRIADDGRVIILKIRGVTDVGIAVVLDRDDKIVRAGYAQWV